MDATTYASLLMACLCVYLGIHRWIVRKSVIRLLDRDCFRRAIPSQLAETLYELNKSGTKLTFGIKCFGHVLVRGKQVTLIGGPVGTVWLDMTWSTTTRLYTLAEPNLAAWMKAHPDLFTPACVATAYSVSWVNPEALEKAL